MTMTAGREDVRAVQEQADLFRHRLDTALAAGLTTEEAVEFASSNADIGLLRYLADCEIDPGLIARIVL